jgi:NAD(P)-dependent dehydrogenase (short-subunit alcohol dehydrogenase family)
VGGRGAEALTAVGDVTSQADVAALAEQLGRQVGGPSVLVNNAGIALLVPAEQTTPGQWRRVLEGTLTGPFRLCQQFAADAAGAPAAGRSSTSPRSPGCGGSPTLPPPTPASTAWSD